MGIRVSGFEPRALCKLQIRLGFRVFGSGG